MPRLLTSPLGYWVDPAAAFMALYGEQTDVVWLDSGPDATAGRSYLGRAARVVSAGIVSSGAGSSGVESSRTVSSPATGSVLEFLRADLTASRIEPSVDGFALGWVGWIGYESRFETMGTARTRTSPYPDAAFLYLNRALAFDHATGEVTLLALGENWQGELGEWRDAVVDTLGPGLSSGAGLSSGPDLSRSAEARADKPTQASEPPRAARWRDSDDEYLDKIRACQAAIAAGDAYLLCLTTEARVEVALDPVSTYLALRASSPSHHGALLRIGDLALLSASPEQFLTVTPGGTVESRPVKGTRARGETPEQDAALAVSLAASEKERAENLMIVDLMRNDLGGVSRVGSVEVPALLTVESYAQVHQLVSTIRGSLDDGLGGMDAVVAAFPAGSMTGTPKSSATRILDSLEGAPRGIYSGVFGYFGLDGRIDLAMVIRSIVLSPDGASVGAGGGITALSDPAEELAEVKLKAAALLRVLGAG